MMLKRLSAIVLTVIIICACISPAVFAQNKEKDYSHLKGTTLNVYNWGEYISDGQEGTLDVNKAFEERYGIQVN